jgi:hypothetical protein
MKRLALASALIALLATWVAVPSAEARVSLPTFNCIAPDEPCQAATQIHATYSAPPPEAQTLTSFTVTLSGQLRAPADGKVCRVRRKIQAPFYWLKGSGVSPRAAQTATTYTDGEGKFSLEVTVTAPAGSTGYKIPVYAEAALRKIKKGRLACEQSETFGGYWSVTPENGWLWGGTEPSSEYAY